MSITGFNINVNQNIERMMYGGMWSKEVEEAWDLYPGKTFVFSTGKEYIITVSLTDFSIEIEEIKKYLEKYKITLRNICFYERNRNFIKYSCLIKINFPDGSNEAVGYLILEKVDEDE